MDDNRLGNLRSDLSQLPDDVEDTAEEIQAAMYHQEVNTLKIEKLSNRVTIISVIIPCIIIAVLAFAYLDMKERVVDVDETQGSQVQHLAAKLDEKLNALDVRIAEVKFALDEALPEIGKKGQALENQLAKLSADKADNKAFQATVKKLEKRIQTNAGQDKTTLAEMERINQDLLAAIKENNTQFKSKSDQIKHEMQLFKEEFDARLMELSAYEQQLGQLSKSLSLMDKQIKTLKADVEKRTEYRIDQLRILMENRLTELEAKLSAQSSAPQKSPPRETNSAEQKPVPQLDTNPSGATAPAPSSSTGSDISEKPLTQ